MVIMRLKQDLFISCWKPKKQVRLAKRVIFLIINQRFLRSSLLKTMFHMYVLDFAVLLSGISKSHAKLWMDFQSITLWNNPLFPQIYFHNTLFSITFTMYCLKSYSSIFVVNMIGTIVGTPLIKGRGWNLPEIESIGGVRNFLLERGDKLEKGGGGWCRNGGRVATFFTTLQFSSIAFTFSDLQSFELSMQDFHPHSHPSLVLKPGTISTFIIHSGSLQKILTALFNLVRNTQKSKWTIFLKAKAKCFLFLSTEFEYKF